MNILLCILIIFPLEVHAEHLLHRLGRVFGDCPYLKVGNCPEKELITYWLSTSLEKRHFKLNVGSLKTAPFIKGPIKFWFHGYMDDHESKIAEDFINAYTSQGQYNVIVVDWSPYNRAGCYIQAIPVIKAVGICVATFLRSLARIRSVRSFHFLGHSQGAHLAAWTSVYVPGLPRLTKFDPAVPFFGTSGCHRGEADFIDVYHSNCYFAGQKAPTGDVDVYFNTGTFQPGCKCDLLCSHIRGIYYYLESIETDKSMKAFPCPYWKEYLSGQCPKPETEDLVEVGERVDKTWRGTFLVFTKATYPYFYTDSKYTDDYEFNNFKETLIKEQCVMPMYLNQLKNWIRGVHPKFKGRNNHYTLKFKQA